MDMAPEAMPCWSTFAEAHVTADGWLSACCFDSRRWWTMGNLSTQPFMNAWNSRGFVQLREFQLKKDVRDIACENCIACG